VQNTGGVDPTDLRRAPRDSVVHHFETWGDIRVDLVKRTGLGRQETRIARPRHTFLMNLRGVAREGEDFINGRRIVFARRQPGSIIYLPANSEWRGWDDGDRIGSYLLVSVESAFTERALGATASHHLVELSPSIGFRDTPIELALQNIVKELKNPDQISAAMVETQAAAIFGRLLRLSGMASSRARGGLSSFDLKRASALLESLCGERPSLADLAKEFDMTPGHFCRAFKQSTGETPHGFMARRRLERSADMLRLSTTSATEIALECGFGSSSNFSIAFRREFGQSPTEFRRLWKS
jgi:AraC-like DNA-binding protein